MPETVVVVGGGLAGSEAAWQLSMRGIKVFLMEMRPSKFTPAHRTPYFAELVCSNSLGSFKETTASGLLQMELKLLGSLVMEAAEKTAVPAGGALAVDREEFSKYITERIESSPLIEVIREEVIDIPDGIAIIAVGPLATDGIKQSLKRYIPEEYLYFFDAVAPLVEADSINWSKVFWGSRYGYGNDYVNCPLTEEEFDAFWRALVSAEVAERHPFDEKIYFESCLPVEVMAKRGRDTLRFGPMKPVGITNPKTGKRPYAVVQLRRDNATETLFNMVGFQTGLKWKEQIRVFRMIPGLENAVFARLGVIHRNFFVNAPNVIKKTLQIKADDKLFLAGQIVGVEGYLPSTAMGLVAGLNAYSAIKGETPYIFPEDTIIGSLLNYITTPSVDFQPVNANWGILPPLSDRIRDRKQRHYLMMQRALESLKNFIKHRRISNIF